MKNIIGNMVFIIVMLFAHLMALSTQSISSKDYFYGVYIKTIKLDEEFKVKIDKEFKHKINKSLFISILIYLISYFILKNIGISILIVTFLYLYLLYRGLKIAYIKVKEYKNKYIKDFNVEINKNSKNMMDTYSNKELILIQNKLVKKFKIMFGVCIGLSILSFLYVAINYKSMPDTIITHWGPSGEPDGFATKSIKDVFLMNFIDLPLVIFLAYISLESLKSRVYIDDTTNNKKLKKAKAYLNGIGYSFLLLTLSIQSMTTIIPIFMVKQSNIPIAIVIIGCIVPIFISVSLIYFYIMLTSLNQKNIHSYQIENDDEKWIYGFIYYNKEDPQFLVQKRLGAGWNMNMANPKGKIFTVLLTVITIVSLILPFM